MVVEASLAFIDVAILPVALAIGLASFTMVTIGVLLSRVLRIVAGKKAEIVGGWMHIGIGSAAQPALITSPYTGMLGMQFYRGKLFPRSIGARSLSLATAPGPASRCSAATSASRGLNARVASRKGGRS